MIIIIREGCLARLSIIFEGAIVPIGFAPVLAPLFGL